MKTAMQELYEILEGYRFITDTISIVDVQRIVGIYYNGKEKEQIIDAVNKGTFKKGTEYYEETYKK